MYCALTVLPWHRLGLFLLSNVLISSPFLKWLDPFMKIINILFGARLKREQKRWILSVDEVQEMIPSYQ